MPRLLQRLRRYRRLATVFAVVTVSLSALLLWKIFQQQKTQQELADTKKQLERAQQAANLGNRTREQAEDLAAFLLNDLRSELIPLGRTDILGQSADRTLNYFENLPPALTTDGTRDSKASILSTLANVRLANGELAAAVTLWDEVIELRKEQLQEEPGNAEFILQLVRAHNERTIPLRAAQRFKAAISADKEALSLLEKIPEQAQNEYKTDIEIARAMTFFSLGENERSAGNTEGAITYYRSSRGSFVDKIPNDTSALQTVMTSYNNTGWCYMNLGNDRDAELAYKKALEPARRLVTKDPDNRHWQKEIATLLNNLGTIYDERGEGAKARPYFEEALTMRASLVIWDPGNSRWQLNYANSLRNLGSLNLDEGKTQEAFDLIQKSLRIIQTLLTREPNNEAWLRTLQRETRHFQNRFQDEEETEIALALNEEVRDFVENLAQKAPLDSAAWNQFLSKLYNDLSISDGTEQEEAITARLKSTTLRASNLESEPESLDTRYQLAAGYLDLALDCLRQEKDREALPCLQLARFLFTEHCPPLLYDREVLIDFILRREMALTWPRPQALTPAKSFWSYYDSRSPPPENWKEVDFDDSSWAIGKGQLGYGDGDESTLLDYGPDSERKNLAAWFRHRFTIEEKKELGQTLRVSLLCDDGAVLYLNGQEVLRLNMPEGEISPTTVASRTQAGRNEDIYRVFEFDWASLPFQIGENIWAAEVHQNEPASSDLSFDLEVLEDASIVDPLQNFDLELAMEFLGEALPPKIIEWIDEHRTTAQP